jgi:hypothetical protein
VLYVRSIVIDGVTPYFRSAPASALPPRLDEGTCAPRELEPTTYGLSCRLRP